MYNTGHQLLERNGYITVHWDKVQKDLTRYKNCINPGIKTVLFCSSSLAVLQGIKTVLQGIKTVLIQV